MLLREVGSSPSLEALIETESKAIPGSHLPSRLEPIAKPPKLSSYPTIQVSRQYLKRSRPLESQDIDANELPPRKKRRLRLTLITSKLSKPYATPPTFIPLPRALRAGVWARHRTAGRDLIRKAAIFNSIAMKRKAFGRSCGNLRNQIPKTPCLEVWTPKPRSLSRSRSPRRRKPPESLTMTECTEDYDEFDAFEPASEIGDDWEDSDGVIYSDFNLIRSDDSDSDVDGYHEEYSFDSFDTGQTLTGEGGVKAIKLLLEIEKNVEFSYAPIFA